jgi:hypothetical protein
MAIGGAALPQCLYASRPWYRLYRVKNYKSGQGPKDCRAIDTHREKCVYVNMQACLFRCEIISFSKKYNILVYTVLICYPREGNFRLENIIHIYHESEKETHENMVQHVRINFLKYKCGKYFSQ